jgi:hypothetical protein
MDPNHLMTTMKLRSMDNTKPHYHLPSGLPVGFGFSYGALLYYFHCSLFASSAYLVPDVVFV